MRSRFDEQLTRLNAEIIDMGMLIEHAIEESVQALFTRDVARARKVADLDREEVSERTGAVKQYWNVAAYDDAGDVVSDGVIMTKIVSLARLAQKEQERTS